MVDYSTPFASSGSKRNPTASEEANGFPCGPADQTLFNGMWHSIQSEIGDIINHAGIVGDNNDLTQLRQAVLALIAAATGGGDTSQFLLTSQAKARLPIFPEVASADGKINVTSPSAGTVRVPSGVIFIHRGVVEVTTTEEDFPTAASKTYHIRWSESGGYELKDLADVGYNPSTLAESDSSFDTTYDDMLIARVVTNSGNNATITNLVNSNRLNSQTDFEERTDNSNGSWLPLPSTNVDLNWSRTPTIALTSLHGVKSNNLSWGQYSTSGGRLADLGLRDSVAATRYGAANLEYAYDDDTNNDGRARFSRSFIAQ